MTSVTEFAPAVLADAIRRQPLSTGKVMFAWQMAAGVQLARASRAEIETDEGAWLSIVVHARDPRWAGEVGRLRPMLIERLALLLGRKITLRIA
jgi:hypothetical protein